MEKPITSSEYEAYYREEIYKLQKQVAIIEGKLEAYMGQFDFLESNLEEEELQMSRIKSLKDNFNMLLSDLIDIRTHHVKRASELPY